MPGVPSNIILSELDTPTIKGNASPIVATSPSLRDGTRPTSNPPQAPAFTLSSGSTSITATITDGKGADSYQIRLENGATVDGRTLSGLNAGTTYSVQVRGVNQYGPGGWSLPAEKATTEAQAGEVTISGSGFGVGPTVVLFDSFDAGSEGDIINLSGPEIGEWEQENTQAASYVAGTRYFLANNRLWMAGRDTARLSENTKLGTGLRYGFAQEVTEFRLAYRVFCPTGYKYPGTESANSNSFTGSNWKITWWGRAEEGAGTGAGPGEPDICIPTTINGHPVAGNNLRWEYGASSRVYVDAPSATAENLWSFYQAPESSEGQRDGVVEYLQCNGIATSRTVHSNADPFHEWNGEVTNESYNMFLLNGWMGNAPTWVDVLPLFADAYVSVGPNARACLITSDAATLEASTEAYLVPPSTWADNEITYTPRSREDLPFRHVITADGTLMENV